MYPKLHLNSAVQHQERYIKKHYPKEYKIILSLPGKTWKERLYMFEHELTTQPLCKICGSPVKFVNSTTGYSTYCSVNCANKSEERSQKIAQTSMERYGVPHYTNRSKFQNTCLARYGVDNPNKLAGVREKISQTNLERYGGVGFASAELKQKTESTIKQEYGAPNIQQVGIQERYPEIISINGDEWKCHCPHLTCTNCPDKTYITNQRTHYTRTHMGMELCTHLNPITTKQTKGTWIELFVRQILDEHNICHEDNTFKIIPPKELDIYLPDYHIGIECNGVFHHSDKRKPAKYHMHKKLFAEAAGIHLINIWEDQLCNKPTIVKSMLLSKLGIFKQRIGARQCQIFVPTAKETRQFLENNHIQGATTSKIRYALKYQDHMIALMTFIQSRGCQGNGRIEEGVWELNRFCTKLNTQVMGAADKLLKHFIKEHQPNKIISFAHNDISWGDVYAKLGFHKEGKTNTSYYYISPNMRRYHRSTFTKAGIVAKGWKDKVDSTWTEREVMDEHKYFRIYDCGTQKWVLHL